MDNTDKNTDIKPKKEYQPFENLKPKHIAAIELLEHSQLSEGQIARALGYHPSYFTTVKNKLEKHSLASPQMRKKAFKAVKETLEMKPHEATVFVRGKPQTIPVFPTHSNRLQAAQMVADRCEPVVNRVESVSVSFSKVDLSEYQSIKPNTAPTQP